MSEAREDNCVFKGFRLNSLFVFQPYFASPLVWLNEEGRLRVMILRREVRRERERDEPKCDAAECCNITGFGRRGNTGKCTLTHCRAHEYTLTGLQKKRERRKATNGILSPQRSGSRTYGFKTCSQGLLSGTSRKDSRQTTCGISDSFHRWGRRIEWVITLRPWASTLLRLKEKFKLHLVLNKRKLFLPKNGFWKLHFFCICTLKWKYFCDNVPGNCKVKQTILCYLIASAQNEMTWIQHVITLTSSVVSNFLKDFYVHI